MYSWLPLMGWAAYRSTTMARASHANVLVKRSLALALDAVSIKRSEPMDGVLTLRAAALLDDDLGGRVGQLRRRGSGATVALASTSAQLFLRSIHVTGKAPWVNGAAAIICPPGVPRMGCHRHQPYCGSTQPPLTAVAMARTSRSTSAGS